MGYIYAIQCLDNVKIGFSANPERRIACVATTTHAPCTLLGVLPGTMHDERAIHRRLIDWRVHGEWFSMGAACSPVRAFIATLTAPATSKVFSGRRLISMNAQIIDLWPSAEQFGCDIGLKYPSYARVMKMRGSIPEKHYDAISNAAALRGIDLTSARTREGEV